MSINIAFSAEEKKETKILTITKMNSRIRQLVRQDLKQIINDVLDYELPAITGGTILQNDLGMDSLDVVELILEVEKLYNIQIPDDAAEKVRTFNEAFKLLLKLTS